MNSEAGAGNNRYLLTIGQLDELLNHLRVDGYQTIGPTLGDGAIVYDEVASVQDLPRGYTDEQEAGSYRLRDNAQGYFAYTTGVQSWKQYLHPPRQQLWAAAKDDNGLRILPNTAPPRKYAFLGVRACELWAIETQDKVFLDGPFVNPNYHAQRRQAFVIVVQCTRAGGTCFCTSMGTGPAAAAGFDIALTEFAEEEIFLAETGSERGAAMVKKLGCQSAAVELADRARERYAAAASQMGRHLEGSGLAEDLAKTYGSGHWEQVARRCLACANCTMVCPTCFCTTVEDTVSLTGDHAGRWQRWDSCFTGDFSYIHGGAVRKSTAARYRQWLLHKLSTWHEQFGQSGCVGCGRCITWCPVGIDITEEAQALRQGSSLGETDRR